MYSALYLENMHFLVMNVRAGVRVVVCCLALFCVVSFLFYSRGLHWTYARQVTGQLQQLVIAHSSATAPLKTELVATTESARCTSPSSTSDAPRKPGGFVLAFRFWEQQTQAMKTVVQLQCLANRIGMRTVEPFLYKSFLGFPFPGLSTEADFLHLGDLIDVDLWNKETTSKFGLFPLSTWSEFLNISPRNLIVVCMRYRNPPRVKIPEPGFDYKTGCPNACYQRFNDSLTVLSKYGQFRVVHKACVNFVDYAGAVSEKSFIDNILGKYDYRDVTVLLNEFRGFFGLYRSQILSTCAIDFFKPQMTIFPSVRIMNDARKYAAGVFNSEPYIAVLVRVERVVLHLEHNLTVCVNALQSLLPTLSNQLNTKRYFLAMDVGKFGSKGAKTYNLTGYGHVLLDAVYGGSVSLEEWESQFELYTSKVEEAYVANLQRAIAARAHCLVMFGAGGFQGQARDFYEKQHPHPEDRCVHKICHEHRDTAAPIHVHMS